MIFGCCFRFSFEATVYYSGQLNTMSDPESRCVGRSRDVRGMKCMSSQGPDPIASHRERVRVHRDDAVAQHSGLGAPIFRFST